MSLGPLEILLLLVVIALLFGAKKLPELMKGMGQGIREFKSEVKEPAVPVAPLQPGQPVQPVQPLQPGQTAQTTVTTQPVVVDVASRQLDPLTDPVTGAPVVNESAVQVPGERR